MQTSRFFADQDAFKAFLAAKSGWLMRVDRDGSKLLIPDTTWTNWQSVAHPWQFFAEMVDVMS